ncbi:copper resistance protein CopC [Edaphobacter modestus]|uniref:copper resistance protein CopC n=1 Tax=Edaphobacter modestus TaxID=388466 RepID=UPI00102D0BD7|nr:copper resistance protein CopC [Edaphobacter modestus]
MTFLRHIALIFLTAGLLLAAPHACGQGCAQCRDNAASTPPATRRAYRHAILLLTVTASGIFLSGVTLLRRSR